MADGLRSTAPRNCDEARCEQASTGRIYTDRTHNPRTTTTDGASAVRAGRFDCGATNNPDAPGHSAHASTASAGPGF